MRSMSHRSRLAGGAAVTALLACSSGQAIAADAPAGEPIPIKTFFRNPDIQSALLSPSGQWVGVLVGGKTARVALAVVDVALKQPAKVIAQFADTDVRAFAWVNDDRLIFDTIDLESGGGDQRFGPGLFSMRRDGSEQRLLIKPRWNWHPENTRITREPLTPNHQVFGIPQDGSNDVIVGEAVFTAGGAITGVNALRLDTSTGLATSLSAGRPMYTQDWLFDPAGEPRVTVAIHEGKDEIFWRGPGAATWTSIGSGPSERMPFAPRFVDGDGHLYVTTGSGAEGYSTLRRFDMEHKRPEREPIVSTPGFDFRGTFITDADGKRVLGVRLTTDATTTVWFDEKMKALQKAVDAKFPGYSSSIDICQRCTEVDVALVHIWADQDPGQYWVYRPPSNSWQGIGPARGDAVPGRMATLDFHRAKARDGEDLPIWVTTPPGPAKTAAVGGAQRPGVVLVHGGPWVRGGSWRWDGEAQFLASRGYVVIEPEFRGSRGYGSKHFRAGWKQWGGAMQDDVADAVRWAADKGLVDPKRVCIAGASYGGYATLMGLVLYPDLYRCGVAWVAVTDPLLLYEPIWNSDLSEEAKRFGLPTLLGDPKTDADMLKAASPLRRAAEIKAPLLLAFGKQDGRVPIEHGDRIRAALKAQGRDPEWILYGDEGHGWLKADNRIDFWSRVERFLAKHIGEGSDAKTSTASPATQPPTTATAEASTAR